MPYSLMRAPLPVWESLVMLGPGDGGGGGDETKEGDTHGRTDKGDANAAGNVNLHTSLFKARRKMMNHRFSEKEEEQKIEMVQH